MFTATLNARRPRRRVEAPPDVPTGRSTYPGCTAPYGVGDPLPAWRSPRPRALVAAHYRPGFGEPFCDGRVLLPRSGADSVAGTAITIERGRTQDTIVAGSSPWATRARLAPAALGLGGASDLGRDGARRPVVVMGGSCQRTWEHAVPWVAHAGPRISAVPPAQRVLSTAGPSLLGLGASRRPASRRRRRAGVETRPRRLGSPSGARRPRRLPDRHPVRPPPILSGETARLAGPPRRSCVRFHWAPGETRRRVATPRHPGNHDPAGYGAIP